MTVALPTAPAASTGSVSDTPDAGPDAGPDLQALLEPDTWPDTLTAAFAGLREWFLATFWSADAGLQLAAVMGAGLAALALAPVLSRLVRLGLARFDAEPLSPETEPQGAVPGGMQDGGADDQTPRETLSVAVAKLVPSALLVVAASVASAGVAAFGVDTTLTRLAVSLALAGFLITLATRMISDPFWRRAAAVTAWTLAGLNAFGLLGMAGEMLDAVGFETGGVRLSLLVVLRAAVIVIALFAIAGWLASILAKRINALPRIEPSIKLLFAKTVQITLLTVASLVGLSTIGIDLSALAIFGGAIGLGIGFGLQQIFANLVAGVILLLDRSIKPGDVIEVDDSYGWVNSLGLRYASVVTRDGHEHLIPNERLMVDKVINWSFSSKAVRVKRSIGISYASDVRRAIELVEAAARDAPRSLQSPPPRCLLIGFGDNSVDLEVRFWISDPSNGVTAAAHDVLLRVWEAFQEHGVEIPFPQRDIHIKSGGELLAGRASTAQPDAE